MNNSFKQVWLIGIGTAVINFILSLLTVICGFIVSPIAAGLAAYLFYKEFPNQNSRQISIKIGLIVGGLSSIGSLLGTLGMSIMVSLPFLLLLITDLNGSTSFSDLLTLVLANGIGALIGVVVILVISLFVIGLCVVSSMIAGKIVSNQNLSSTNQLDANTSK
jgi:hypothetical protein